MANTKAEDSAESTVEILYPNANGFTKEALRATLTDYARRYADVFGGLMKPGSKSNKYGFPSKSHCFVKNLLELDGIIGSKQAVVQILTKLGTYAERQKLLNDRVGEIQFRSGQYQSFLKRSAQILNLLLSSNDLKKESIFEGVAESIDSGAMDSPSMDQRCSTSFIGLGALRKIENIERNNDLSEVELDAHKAILYLEMNSAEHALEHANAALEKDPENGYAWMVKGHLALEGVLQAFREGVLHQEMGANIHPVSAEEQWHQELLDEAADWQADELKRTVDFFLKAWAFWPSDAALYMLRADKKKQQIMVRFFSNVLLPDDFDHELLRNTIHRDMDEVKHFILLHPDVGLKKILPIINAVSPEAATEIARHYISSVVSSGPRKNKSKPSDPSDNTFLSVAGRNLSDLQALSIVLPFEEVEQFVHDVDRRFKEVVRVTRLKNFSQFYLDKIVSSGTLEALEICCNAQENIPFLKRSYDQWLCGQWRYLYFRLMVQLCLEMILANEPGTSKEIAWLLSSMVSLDLITDVNECDCFERLHQDDDLYGESQEGDLAGGPFNVLKEDFGITLSDMFKSAVMGSFLNDVLSGNGESKGMGYSMHLLLCYMNQILKGMTMNYGDYLRSIEEGDLASDPESRWGALDGHTAFSFILAYALKDDSLLPTERTHLDALSDAFTLLQADWVK